MVQKANIKTLVLQNSEKEISKFGKDKYNRMRMLVEVGLPPTDNKIYFNLPRGGRALSSVAIAFKRSVKFAVDRIITSHGGIIKNSCTFLPDRPYEIYITLYMHGLSTKGWVEGKAKNRYKRIDTTNRQKLLIDAVMEAIGIDDSHIFEMHIKKIECASKEEEKAWILLREIIDESDRKDINIT